MMKLTSLTCMLALAGAVSVGAQSSESTTKTKIDVKDGKDMKVTGCVASEGAGYVLTNVADKKGTRPDYMLVDDDHDVAKHLGHRVQISGKATDRDGKIEVETKTKTKVKHGDDQETSSKSTLKGDMPGMA